MSVTPFKCAPQMIILYNYPVWPLRDASTILEYVNAFHDYSQFNIYPVNTYVGFPALINHINFPVIILHYSLFGTRNYLLNRHFLKWLAKSDAYKVAIFQDENSNIQQRRDFINRYRINCIYTLIDQKEVPRVYGSFTPGVTKVITALTGYVSPELISKASQFAKPDAERSIDVGYRARRTPYYLGRGAQEKYNIATGFMSRLNGEGLTIDIATDERSRLYNDDWHRFLGNCRCCLGAMAGISLYDFDGSVQERVAKMIKEKPKITFDEVYTRFLHTCDDNLHNRVISPRIFEAAAFRVCQVLFEDNYQGVVKPMVHYIPLKKDFSNFQAVIKMIRDAGLRKELTDNCYRDLIDSRQYSYHQFIYEFDAELMKEGYFTGCQAEVGPQIALSLNNLVLYATELTVGSSLIAGSKVYRTARKVVGI